MIKDQLAAYELLLDMIKGKTGHLSKTSYYPQKQVFDSETPIEQSFPRSTPEEEGISSRYLASFLQEIAQKEETDIHGVMVLRHGKVIGEYSFTPYEKGIWHIEHSLCKSITGMAIGLLIEEGKLKLEDRIVRFFSKKSILGNVREKNITIEDLLTMRSGVAFNEVGILSGDDWVKSYLDSAITGPPGVKFEYNSMNTYLLSAIVTEVTGESLTDYLKPRLFAPLGIRKVFWESCPKGITKGGWGLFMCQEDVAKLGELYLRKGKWKGRQILSEEWVERSVEKHVETPPEMGYHGYGYQIWRSGREGSFNFNGMLGQNVLVYPDLDMILVLNAGSDELFQNCILLNVVRKYFEGDFQPPESLLSDALAYQHLQTVSRRLESGTERNRSMPQGGWKRKAVRRKRVLPASQHQMRAFDGKSYQLAVTQVGIFPLLMQVFHNNFTDGIEKIGFKIEDGKCYLLVWEGKDELKIEIGFSTSAISIISIHGETYLISVKGAFHRNDEDHAVLSLNIAYLEEAVRRKIKIIFPDQERIQMCFDETPGKNLIMEGLSSMLQMGSEKNFLKNLTEFGNLGVTELLVNQTIRPVIEGKLMDTE